MVDAKKKPPLTERLSKLSTEMAELAKEEGIPTSMATNLQRMSLDLTRTSRDMQGSPSPAPVSAEPPIQTR